MPRASIADYVRDFAAYGRDVAYVHRRGYRTERWSYEQVAAAAAQFARELERSGIAKGDKVLIWGDNCAEWVVAFLGCILRGVMVVPLDRAGSRDFARRVNEQVDAKLLVASRELLGSIPGMPELELESLGEALQQHSSAPYDSPPLGRDDIVQIIFTSGTTAEPKGVVISHGNILANLEPLEREIAKYLKYERWFHPIRFLNLLPLSHVFGQFLGIFVPQLIGGTVLFSDTLNPGEVQRIIKRERVSVLVAVPRMLESLKDKLERDLRDDGTWERFQQRFVGAQGQKFIRRMLIFRDIHRLFGWKFWAFISGGAALGSKIEEFWNRLGYAVIQGYGLTESTSLISVNHPFKVGRGSIGKVLPGRDIRLDETGEILVRGSNIAAGYWQGKQVTPVSGDEGWFRTGDMGELDAEGNLYFKGRKKNVIVTPAGLNIYPEDLEAALRRQPEVREAVVVGLARNGNAEPAAAVLLREGADAAAVIKRANEHLAEFQQMRRWYVWPEQDFPRTSTQKPRTNVIAEAVQRHFGTTGAEGGHESGGVTELIGKITGKSAAALADNAKLEDDLNMSSIDRVELMAAIEDRYQIEVSDAALGQMRTVGDLQKLLAQPAAGRTEYSYWRWPMRWPFTWIRRLIYYLLAWPATLLLGGAPRVIGRERLRNVRRPVLIVSNHIAYVDIGFVLWALPHHLRRTAIAMQGEMLAEMRRPPRTWNRMYAWANQISYWLMTALFNVFPLPQRAGFRESFRFAGEAADQGYNVVVFPEGRRSEAGEIQPFRAGIGLLANNLNLPIVPMRIDGLGELKRRGRRGFASWRSITVRVGAPVTFPPHTEPGFIAKELEKIVRGL